MFPQIPLEMTVRNEVHGENVLVGTLFLTYFCWEPTFLATEHNKI
jgi:hypothetical protein